MPLWQFGAIDMRHRKVGLAQIENSQAAAEAEKTGTPPPRKPIAA